MDKSWKDPVYLSGTGMVYCFGVGIEGKLGIRVKLGLGIPGNNQGFGFIQIREGVEDISFIQDS